MAAAPLRAILGAAPVSPVVVGLAIYAALVVIVGGFLVLGLCMAAAAADRMSARALNLAPARRRVDVASPYRRNGRGSRSPRRVLPNRSRGESIVHHLGKDRLP
jgi:hypothetical protein